MSAPVDDSTFVDDCEFCRIAQGLGDSVVRVGRGAEWVAFFPLNPATPGHTLIVPKHHVRDYWQLDERSAEALAKAALQVGHAIERALQPEGMNLITSAGSTAEQTVFHLHLHVVPRWRRDGFGDIWPHGHRYEDADLSKAASTIRTELAAETVEESHGDA